MGIALHHRPSSPVFILSASVSPGNLEETSRLTLYTGISIFIGEDYIVTSINEGKFTQKHIGGSFAVLDEAVRFRTILCR